MWSVLHVETRPLPYEIFGPLTDHKMTKNSVNYFKTGIFCMS